LTLTAAGFDTASLSGRKIMNPAPVEETTGLTGAAILPLIHFFTGAE